MSAASLPPPDFTPPPPNLPPPVAAEPAAVPREPIETNTPPTVETTLSRTSSVAQTQEETEALESERQIQILVRAFKYPLSQEGRSILIPGCILAVLLMIGGFAPAIGFFATLFSAGYFASYYLDIIASTINGDENPPDWPVISDFAEDILWPALAMTALGVISFCPTFLYSLYAGKIASDGIIGSLLYFAGCAYFPMAMIAFVMHSSVSAALPHRVIPAILRCLPEYFLPVVFLIGIKITSVLLEGALSILPIILSSTLITMLGFYLLMVQARITGLTARDLRERIAWG